MPAQIFSARVLWTILVPPLPGTKALIVIGGSSVKRLGYLDRVQALLKNREWKVLFSIKCSPTPWWST